MDIKNNERIDDLGLNNLKIIQNKNWFCFGIDSILLSDFSKNIKPNSEVVDLGTGTAILPILLSAKSKAKHFDGIEIQEEVADMALRSVALNNLEEKISILNLDIKDLVNKGKKYDVVISNPPYMKTNSGAINDNPIKMISRHELKCTIKDIANISYRILKDRGEIYIVHRPDRLVDIIETFRKNKLEIKEVTNIHSREGEKAVLVLIKAIKNGKPFLRINPPLYIYEKDNRYTSEILKIYNIK